MIDFITQVSREAGKILLSFLNTRYRVSEKPGLGYVGEADLASEKYIIGQIISRFPGSRILAEESGLTGREDQAPLTWIVDPLDGTTNFLHGFPFFSVSIAVMEGNTLTAGAVYDPFHDELYAAARGKGAMLNGEPIHVSETASFKDSLLITGFYYHQGEKLTQQVERFRRIQEKTLSVRRLGSAALDLCYVASGRADGFWEDGLSSWDMAAGVLLVQEAGGRFTDRFGGPGDIFGPTVACTNGRIHADLLAELRDP